MNNHKALAREFAFSNTPRLAEIKPERKLRRSFTIGQRPWVGPIQAKPLASVAQFSNFGGGRG